MKYKKYKYSIRFFISFLKNSPPRYSLPATQDSSQYKTPMESAKRRFYPSIGVLFFIDFYDFAAYDVFISARIDNNILPLVVFTEKLYSTAPSTEVKFHNKESWTLALTTALDIVL